MVTGSKAKTKSLVESPLERVVGTLFALSIMGSAVCASAEPTARVKPSQLGSSTSNDINDAERVDRADRAYRTFLAVADADADSQVTGAELKRLVEEHVVARVRARFARLDRNQDGKVTAQEVPSMDRARFARFDLNRDAAFTASELADVVRSQATRRCERILARLDSNSDGTLSLADLDHDTQGAKVAFAAFLKSDLVSQK